jgi:hypothetical protein
MTMLAASRIRERSLGKMPTTSVRRPGAITVAMGQPLLRRPLAARGADQLRHLRLHQLLTDPSQRLAQEIEPFPLEQVADDPLARHALRLGHRGDSSRRRLGGLDESERRGGRTNYPAPSDAPTPRHGT